MSLQLLVLLPLLLLQGRRRNNQQQTADTGYFWSPVRPVPRSHLERNRDDSGWVLRQRAPPGALIMCLLLCQCCYLFNHQLSLHVLLLLLLLQRCCHLAVQVRRVAMARCHGIDPRLRGHAIVSRHRGHGVCRDRAMRRSRVRVLVLRESQNEIRTNLNHFLLNK